MILVKTIAMLIFLLFQVGYCPVLSGENAEALCNQEIDDLETFLEDPVANFDRIKALALSSSHLHATSHQDPARIKGGGKNWDEARKRCEDFENHPSLENAKIFLRAIPGDKTGERVGDKGKAIDWILRHYPLTDSPNIVAQYAKYHIPFHIELLAGNRYLVRAALRLMCSDDPRAEKHLRVSLSALVRVDPRLFLQSLYGFRNHPYFKRTGYPVDGFLDGYTHRGRARLYELSMRIEALERVGDRKLRRLKNACISQLREDIKLIEVETASGGRDPVPQERVCVETEELDWAEVEAAFEAFLEYPSPENARAIGDSLRLRARVEANTHLKKSAVLMPMTDDLNILENEAWAGNRFALEAAVRLSHHVRSGIPGKLLVTAINEAMRLSPRLYLEVLYEHQDLIIIGDEGIRVSSIGVGYNLEAYPFVYEMKIQALESVNDLKYRQLRDALIEELKETLTYIRKVLERWKSSQPRKSGRYHRDLRQRRP